MKTQTCSRCGAPFEVISEVNRVEGQFVCWTCLVPDGNERWKVTLRWAADLPTVTEVGRLRALVPELQKKTSKELWKSLKGKSKVDLGEYLKPHLDQLLARNEKYGFRLELKNKLDDRRGKTTFERLLLAVLRNDAAKVAALAAKTPDLNALTEEGADLLSCSIEAGSEEAAQALIEAGICLANAASTYTAMQTALENGMDSILDALLDRKADLNCQGAAEDSYALHLLCRNYRSPELLARFLENGADPRRLDNAGQTALMILQLSLEDADHDAEKQAMMQMLKKAAKTR